MEDDARSVSPDMTMTDFHCDQTVPNLSSSSVEAASEQHTTSLTDERYNFWERRQSTFVRDRSEAHLVVEGDVRTYRNIVSGTVNCAGCWCRVKRRRGGGLMQYVEVMCTKWFGRYAAVAATDGDDRHRCEIDNL